VTVREVVRLLAKALLLFLPALQQQPAFGALWRAILDSMQVGCLLQVQGWAAET
jgi:hypothetical protein